MDFDRFRECAAAYGAAQHRWPLAARALYDRFAGTPEGGAILGEAERTDRFLDAWESLAGSSPDALARAILDRSALDGRMAPRSPILRWWRFGAIATAVVAGLALGLSQSSREPRGDLITQFILGPASPRGIGL
jgi:hypothetical protein